jgi:hypothetical protein
MEMQIQHLNCSLVELKTSPPNAGTMEFSGYGAVFNNVDGYSDVIAPGAFTKYLEKVTEGKDQWPLMLSQHGGWGLTAQDLTPIGVWTGLHEDEKGLHVTGTLADTPRGQEAYTLIKMQPRPAYSGLSIGFHAVETVNGKKGDSFARMIKQIDLVEVSLVSRPANDKAQILSVKSANDFTEREFESYLRDLGLTKKEALVVISQGFRALQNLRDSDEEAKQELIDKHGRNLQFLKNYGVCHGQ